MADMGQTDRQTDKLTDTVLTCKQGIITTGKTNKMYNCLQ